jgi:hypothetical protein
MNNPGNAVIARAAANARQGKGKGWEGICPKGKESAPGGVVPEGPNESSPVRSAGLAFRKSDPSRTGRSTFTYACDAAWEGPGTECFYRPLRDGHSLSCIISQHFVLGYFR